MKILLIGGSGKVGTFITPYLLKEHELRVLDIRPPVSKKVEFIEGSICDPTALKVALTGCDSFINLVMMGAQGGTSTEQDIELIQSNYAVNAMGLHLLLYTAQSMKIMSGVHTSTMSVHFRERARMGRYVYTDENLTNLDSPSVYGLTKGLGENICAYFATWFEMNIVALRITGPRTREEYLAERKERPKNFTGPLFVTDEEDLAKAYLAALKHVSIGHGNFEAMFISGDELEIDHNMSRARRLLGWAPQSQSLVD